MNQLWLIFLCIVIVNCSEQQMNESVQCNIIEVNHQDLAKMNMEQQEKYAKSVLEAYDKNLTTIAYLTSAAEFETHLNLNDTNLKHQTNNLYEVYRNCLKIVAFVGRQLRFLINNNQSSLHWLLLRTQAIGDAGETDTGIKVEIQQLKTRIKEIYHQKFVWNNTRYALDDIQESLGLLQSPDDLLSLWNAVYEVPISMRDYYVKLIAVQNQQARQNRTSAVTHSHI